MQRLSVAKGRKDIFRVRETGCSLDLLRGNNLLCNGEHLLIKDIGW